MSTKIAIQLPQQDAEGQVSLVSVEVNLNLENIYFIHKQPLQPGKVISCLTPTPLMTQGDIDESTLEESGFIKFDTPEGSWAWVNVRASIFSFTPELGVYVYVFPGGSKVGVKATGKEIDEISSNGGLVL